MVGTASLSSSALLAAYRAARPHRTPVWFMRQAGRFLPEYRAVRAQHRMLDVIRTPELAAEVTLQPLRRFDLDAAIIFADILNPLIGMGISLDFVEGEGPRIFNPVTSASDVARLVVPTPEENVGYTLEAITRCVAELTPRGIPVIGFSGAPFTLSAYLIEGTGTRGLHQVKRFMWQQPEAWHALQEKLTKLVAEYLVAQVGAGASALQLFDSWLGVLGPLEYEQFVAPHLARIVQQVKSQVAVPVVYFAPASTGLYPQIADLTVDVFGVDWRTSLSHAASLLGGRRALQGNLDPDLLFAPPELLEQRVRSILEERASLPGHVFNLGHGIQPNTPIESVERVLAVIRGSAPGGS